MRYMQENNSVQSVAGVTPNGMQKSTIVMVIAVVAVIVAGVFTGRVLSGGDNQTTTIQPAAEGKKEAGVSNTDVFKDVAQGKLEVGGIDGEGQYHLVRDGGPSQTVYLTSTVVDLSGFVGKKVQVWGQTLSAKKAGWLMDVGKVKVIE